MDSGFDVLPQTLRDKLEQFLVEKMKLALLQKMVMPNRKVSHCAHVHGDDDAVPTSTSAFPGPSR